MVNNSRVVECPVGFVELIIGQTFSSQVRMAREDRQLDEVASVNVHGLCVVFTHHVLVISYGVRFPVFQVRWLQAHHPLTGPTGVLEAAFMPDFTRTC